MRSARTISIVVFLFVFVLLLPAIAADSVEQIAEQLLDHVRCERAKRLLQKSGVDDPSNESARGITLLAQCYMRLGEYEEAARSFDRAIKLPFYETVLVSSSRDLQVCSGYCYYKLGEYSKAIERLSLADTDGLDLLSCAKIRLKGDAGELRQDDFRKTERVALLMHAPRIRIVLEEAELPTRFSGPKGNERAWNSAVKLFWKGKELEDRGQFKIAESNYKNAVEQYKDEPELIVALALCRFTQIDHDMEIDQNLEFSQIIDLMSAATSLDKRNWKLWNNLALMQFIADRPQDANKSVRNALNCIPPVRAKEALLQGNLVVPVPD